MSHFDASPTKNGTGSSNAITDSYTPETKIEQVKWLDRALRAQGFSGQQALITLDEFITRTHESIPAGLAEAQNAKETLTDLLTRRDTLRQDVLSKAKYLKKDITYDIWSLVFRFVLDLVHADTFMDLLAHPAVLLRPSLDFSAVNASLRRDVLTDAVLWSFLPVHLGRVLQGDPYELSQIKMYLNRIGDRIPAHLCVRGWTDDEGACTSAFLKVFPFLLPGRQSAPGPNIEELTIIGTVKSGTGTLKHLPAVFLPLVPVLSGLSLLSSSSGIMHALSLRGFPSPKNLRMLNIDLRSTEQWKDDWHFPALFMATGTTLRSFRLRTNYTPISPASDRRPPARMEIFVCLTELDICLDDIGGCLTGLLFGYHQFISLQKLTLVTHGQWADIGFTWAQTGIVQWLKPKWLTIVAWVPKGISPKDEVGFEWVTTAIGDMESVETLELKGAKHVNSHIQRFLGEIHIQTPICPQITRFRNLKRLLLRDASFDATALIKFVESQKTRADSMGGYAYYIDVVFQGECEGLKAVFEQQRPRESTPPTPTTISNELTVLKGGVNIPVTFISDDETED
jgi:hypothetical protein